MKTIIKIFLAILCVLPLGACNKWLDVKPTDQVSAEDLLSTTEGFNNALSGVYYTISQTNLYGQNLQYGLIDALAQYWDISSTGSPLYQAKLYNYKDAGTTTTINGIWTNMYFAIANTNKVLESLDKTSADKIANYNLIKGEALGLRAFLHMELLKMFGPVLLNGGMDKPAIPYRKSFNKYAQKFNTSSEVINLIAADLSAARELLKADPIRTLGRTGNGNSSNSYNYNSVLDFRGARINIYAIMGLQARLAQLKNDQNAAYTYSMELINELKANKVIRFITKDEISTVSSDVFRDIRYSMEMIFSLYVNNLSTSAGPAFAYTGFKAISYPFKANTSNVVNFIYATDGSVKDYRSTYWFPSSSGSTILFLKYMDAANVSGLGQVYGPEVSLMRLPEIYYIAAEAQVGKNDQMALDLLNEVRATRGLDPIAFTDIKGSDDMMTRIVNEQRKEFIGEGKMFFLSKRLFRDITINNTSKIAASTAIFVFPIPNDEYEYSPNPKN